MLQPWKPSCHLHFLQKQKHGESNQKFQAMIVTIVPCKGQLSHLFRITL